MPYNSVVNLDTGMDSQTQTNVCQGNHPTYISFNQQLSNQCLAAGQKNMDLGVLKVDKCRTDEWQFFLIKTTFF